MPDQQFVTGRPALERPVLFGDRDDEPAGRAVRRRRRRWQRLVGVVVVVALGWWGYGWLAAYVADRLPRGASVAGVDIGGLTEQEASQRLRDQLAAQLDLPLRLTAGRAAFSVVPSSAGLRLDVAATVQAARGGGPDTLQLARSLYSGAEVAPVLSVDGRLLRARLGRIAAAVARPAVDGAVSFGPGGAPVVRAAAVGLRLDLPDALHRVPAAWRQGADTVELRLVGIAPRTSAGEVAAAAAFARQATSGPVRLDVGARSVLLSRAMLGGSATLVPAGSGRLVPIVTVAALRRSAAAVLDPLSTPARDATVRLVAGRPAVVAARTGTTVPFALVAARLPAAMGAQGVQRHVSVPAPSLVPRFTTAQARGLQIRRVVAVASRPLPAPPPAGDRTDEALARVDGRLLWPGQRVDLRALATPPAPAQPPAPGPAGVPGAGPRPPGPLTPLVQAASAALAGAGARTAGDATVVNATRDGFLLEVGRAAAPAGPGPAAATPRQVVTVRVWGRGAAPPPATTRPTVRPGSGGSGSGGAR